jgi:flagellar basal-body rod modification protein FlgD
MSSATTASATVSNPLLSALSSTPATTQVGAQANDPQMNEFLQLLTAQLQNQDPLSPTDPTQFVAQLAQFSTVEQLVQSNTTLSNISQSLSGLAVGQYAGLIDKTVTAAVTTINVSGSDSPPALTYNVTATGLSHIGIQVLNANGEVVNTVAVSGSSGHVQVGTDANGNPLPAGSYKVQLMGTSSTGTPQSAGTLTSSGTVASVVQGSGGDWQLKLNNGLNVEAAGVTAIN